MSAPKEPHPVLVDTSGLIAAANTDLWDRLCDEIRFATTNVCEQELRRHVRESSEYAPEGTREHQLRRGSGRALTALEDGDVAFTSVTCVPRPHGADAGEESLRRVVAQDPDAYQVIVVMDAAGRRSIRRTLGQEGVRTPVVAPTYLFFLLFDRGHVSREQFCEACGEMLRNEGWTGYQAVKTAWERIPVDCSDTLDDEILP